MSEETALTVMFKALIAFQARIRALEARVEALEAASHEETWEAVQADMYAAMEPDGLGYASLEDIAAVLDKEDPGGWIGGNDGPDD